ncbi:MAG: VWA domain-containing protein [Phycisphaerales bacterium]|nr:VWA domain-containing protein [Phycisphaerales bacterium]
MRLRAHPTHHCSRPTSHVTPFRRNQMTMIPPSIPPAQPSRRSLGSLLGMEPPLDDPDSGGGAPADRARRERKEPMKLPLAKVVARVTIVGDCAQTELQEHYTNPHDRPLDVRHTIPLAHGAAVTGVEIRAGGRTVRGVCRRIEEARDEHASAKRRGKTTALIQQRRDDLHEISLGNVPPGASIVIALTIVERLRVADGRFEFNLPTAISPKFVPGRGIGHDGDGWGHDTEDAPDASHLTPPVLVGPAPLVELDVTLAAGATDIRSSVALTRTDDSDGRIRLRPAGELRGDGDVVIRFWGRETKSVLRAYSDGRRTLVVADPPVTRQPQHEQVREAVYLLDRSGSMEGSRLESAVRALKASLHSLSPRDYVQIIAFGSSLTNFRPRPTRATADTVDAAMRWLDRIRAEGGTNAVAALQVACTSKVASKRVRTVLLITDGNVANDAQILNLVQAMDPATRLFTLGIGQAPSHALLSRLARLGGGTYESVTRRDDIEAEIVALDAALAGPIAYGLRESGEEDSNCGPRADLFSGRAASFFLEGHRERVRIESVDGSFSAECAVQSSPMQLGALWARDEVERLEDRRIAKPELAAEVDAAIADLGVTHQIQTRLTSFVAVDEASQAVGEPIAMVQPVAAPRDSGLIRNCIAVPQVRSIELRSSYCDVMDRPDHDASAYHDRAHANRFQGRFGAPVGRGGAHPTRRRTSHTLPIIELLGGTHGLPPKFGSRDAWVRCGLGLIVDAHDVAMLREISRKIGFPRQIAPEALYAEHMTLAHALVMMILAVAWDAVDWEDGATGDPLNAGSPEPPPEQWERIAEVLKAHAAHPGMVHFMVAGQASDIPGMIRAAACIAANMVARA